MAIDAAMTLELIGRYGSSATFHEYAASAYDKATGKTTPGAVTDHSHDVVEDRNKEVLEGDAEVMLYASPSGMLFTPVVGMEVTYAGQTWSLDVVRPIKYAGTTVLWVLGASGVAG
jgi:hypothetical protein